MSTNVSIIIPAYNVENYIEKCLYSAVNKTMEDIEIIVINDVLVIKHYKKSKSLVNMILG